jgi:hypothetical protein
VGSEYLSWTDENGRQNWAAGEDAEHFWRPIGPDFTEWPEDMQLQQRGGKVLLASNLGLYERDGGGWKRLIDPADGTGAVRGFLDTRSQGELLVAENGLWKIAPAPDSLGAGWRVRIVQSLGGQLESQKDSGAEEDMTADDAGAIRKRGRTIFSALRALLGR